MWNDFVTAGDLYKSARRAWTKAYRGWLDTPKGAFSLDTLLKWAVSRGLREAVQGPEVGGLQAP